jgi:hypothetical protein
MKYINKRLERKKKRVELTGEVAELQGNDGDGPVGRKFSFLKPVGDIAIDEVKKKKRSNEIPLA